jgi:hypothetical protein
MRRVIDTSEVIGTVEMPEGECEVCASALARYDEDTGQLHVDLHAFLRTSDIRKRERHLTAEWLPKPETIAEGVGPDETIELAKDIFHAWVAKVREATPALRCT